MSVATAPAPSDDFRRRLAALAGALGRPKPGPRRCLTCGRQTASLVRGQCSSCRHDAGGRAG